MNQLGSRSETIAMIFAAVVLTAIYINLKILMDQSFYRIFEGDLGLTFDIFVVFVVSLVLLPDIQYRIRGQYPRFSFEINEKNPETAYVITREKFLDIFKGKIENERLANSFSHQTTLANTSISFAAGTHGMRITGTVRKSTFILGAYTWLFIAMCGFVINFALSRQGAPILVTIPLVIALISRAYDLFVRDNQRKKIGLRLCVALRGTNFQQ